MELVHERLIAMTDDTGKSYDCVRVYAQPQAGGTWAGILEFLPTDGSDPVRSGRETTQSTPDFVAYWGTGLEPIYFEGALARALRQPAEPAPDVSPITRARRVARLEVESVDPQLPLRVMGTRTLTRGLRRRINDAATVVYEGPTRDGCYAFIVHFGTDNSAAIVANVLWTELRAAEGIFVEGTPVMNSHAALKNALIVAAPERLAG